MSGVVPESVEAAAALVLGLETLLEATKAECGWIGRRDAAGRLTFPIRRGKVPASWLAFQSAHSLTWGIVPRGQPALLNALPPWPEIGSLPLINLLACPLAGGGQLAAANKGNGFSPDDAVRIQAIASLLDKLVESAADLQTPQPLSSLPLEALERAGEGVYVLDESGTLVFANATWAEWTGLDADQLLLQRAPFAFWADARHLAALTAPAVSLVTGESGGDFPLLPFRRADDSLFWRHVESRPLQWQGRAWTLVTLRMPPAIRPTAASIPAPAKQAPAAALLDCLPFPAVLTDRSGRTVGANEAARRANLAATPFHTCFALSSAAVVEHLLRGPRIAEQAFGRLVLTTSDSPHDREWVAYWLAVPPGPTLAAGGFLFLLAEDWQTVCPPDDLAAEWRREIARPAANWAALILRRGQPIQGWDGRWEKLTGLKPADLAGVAGEVVLDWLFPHQPHRNFVADQLQQPMPAARGSQAVLHLLSPGGSQPLLCTFLPVAGSDGDPAARAETWLLLVGEPRYPTLDAADANAPTARTMRHFARGLGHLLNHYLALPIALAEMALDRNDLPPSAAQAFEQILDGCGQAAYLVAAIQDLAAADAGETMRESLAEVVREILKERSATVPPSYEVTADLQDEGTQVRVNPRMLRVVLRHLLTNAEQALVNSTQHRISVRVWAREDGVCCAIADTGEGLSPVDPTGAAAPFYSTKGPFARDAAHAALPGTGLGLTVSHHLLALHGGRLELDNHPDGGAVALIVLPHAAGTGAPRSGLQESRAASAVS